MIVLKPVAEACCGDRIHIARDVAKVSRALPDENRNWAESTRQKRTFWGQRKNEQANESVHTPGEVVIVAHDHRLTLSPSRQTGKRLSESRAVASCRGCSFAPPTIWPAFRAAPFAGHGVPRPNKPKSNDGTRH
jgi:hypothetical protein